MAKSFAPRISKKEREVIHVDEKHYKLSDEKLLQGAKLDKIKLKDIQVKEQVRTKFNDDSLRELAANIKVNGLIQPLVLHKKGGRYTLICGERRFRAMSLIPLEEAPCFVLDNKTEEELMAIQFSENSSREQLHYIDRADGVANYQKATGASERKIVDALGICKTEVHRSLMVAKLSSDIKEAAKKYDIEKYVLLEYDGLTDGPEKLKVADQIIAGKVVSRNDLKKVIAGKNLGPAKKPESGIQLPKGISAQTFLKALTSKSKEMNLDSETKKILQNLVNETKEIVDL